MGDVRAVIGAEDELAEDELVATEHSPVYRKVAQPDSGATQLWMITCDEGWRSSIVCERMYEWAADWLLDTIGRRPYALGYRPDPA